MSDEFEQAIRLIENAQSRIQHENDVCNHRMTWMVLIEGLLFTAVGLSHEKADAWRPAICLIGMSVSVSCFYVQVLGGFARTEIKKHARKMFQEHKISSERFPQIMGFDHHRSVYWGWVYPVFAPWYLLPIVFLLGWAWILIVLLFG